MKRFGIVAGIFLVVCLVFTCARAQADIVPQLINYQGYLTDKDGMPLATAEYKLSFSIYTVSTGGTAAWGPQAFDKVPVVRGYFNVILPINDVFRYNATTYLAIVVNDGSAISPRQQILSTPYALKSFGDVPVGSVIPFAGTVAPPGFLPCDGTHYSTTDPKYANLFAVIGVAFGNYNDGFAVPDLRGRFPIGGGQGNGLTPRNLGAAGGRETVTLTESQMPAHRHAEGIPIEVNTSVNIPKYGVKQDYGPYRPALPAYGGAYDPWSDYAGGGQAHEIMPPFIGINYIIKY